MRLSYADVVAKPPRPRPTSIESHRRFITNTSYVQNLEQCDTPININANEETEFPDKIKDGGLDLSVVVTGPDVPSPIVNFTDVDFSPTIIKNIRKAYVCPTPIQRHAIPVIMAGHDIMACAQTGSGKTAAFCFPIISGVLKEFRRVPERLEKVACPLALILSPTRELCCQIFEVSKNFCNQTGVKVAAAYGGEPKSLQLKSFESGVDILVATPGRLIDFCELSKVSLKMIKYMVIDEADLMLHMGFEPQIRKIVEHTEIPRVGRRQTMLFCATLPYKVQTLASAFLSDHVFISVGRGGSSTHLIIQELMLVEDNEKPQRLKELLDYPIANGNLGKTALVLIFVATKKGAYSLECWLNCNGFSAVSLHGDKCQMERERALASFKMGLTPILVATDLASRGLDVAGIAQVVNYDLPRDIDTYVQRIGRTGRAGKGGRATSFFTSKNLCLAKALSALLKECHQDAPNWLYKYAERYMCLNDHHLDFNKSLKVENCYDRAVKYSRMSGGKDQEVYLETKKTDYGTTYDKYAFTSEFVDCDAISCDTKELSLNELEANESEKGVRGGEINFDAYEDIPVNIIGLDVPNPINMFIDVDFGGVVNETIRHICKYSQPTPIQRHAIPVLMGGRDLMACAQTGSGKTAAFCLPIISGMLKDVSKRSPEEVMYPLALILSPTRELCFQIYEEAKKFSYQTSLKVCIACGGEPKSLQLKSFESGLDILVATPGRLIDFCEASKVSLKMIKYMVIDEADRMLDMGFEPQIRKIVEHTENPRVGRRQTMLFSATLPKKVQTLALAFLSDHVFISVGRAGSSTHLIIQELMLVEDNEKPQRLKELLDYQIANGNLGKTALVLIFVATKRGANALECWLNSNGFSAVSLHGDKCQRERERALASFKMGLTPILVATDLASRGLDVAGIAQVVNYDLPRDIDTYVQRIGRTGRAGKRGLATSFFTSKNSCIAKALSELLKECHQDAPNWLYQYAKRYMSFRTADYLRISRGYEYSVST